MQHKEIAENFGFEGDVLDISRYGNGHINDTYLLTTDSDKRYILQKINRNVFKQPDMVMQNIIKVTEYLKNNMRQDMETLTLVPCKNKGKYHIDENGDYWRMYDFIENSVCLDVVESAEDFYECAYAFGTFQKNLSGFPADTLFEVIPRFHNTPSRYRDFLRAVSEDKVGRVKNAKDEIDFITERKDFYSLIIDAEMRGDLPLRVTHNDTKSNNVMLDKTTRKALCVIDLDTVMPGYSVTDFGDAIRFGASTAAEDEKDLNKVHFDIKLYEAYLKGFLDGCGGKLQNTEIMLLPEGAKMMTIECGMRFLSDYLNGDIYFKTAYPEHNLVRARTQLKLVKEIEKNWAEMQLVANRYY